MSYLEAVEIEALVALSQLAKDGIRDGLRCCSVEVTNTEGDAALKAEITLQITRLVSRRLLPATQRGYEFGAFGHGSHELGASAA